MLEFDSEMMHQRTLHEIRQDAESDFDFLVRLLRFPTDIGEWLLCGYPSEDGIKCSRHTPSEERFREHIKRLQA